MKLYLFAFLLLVSCGAKKVLKTETSEISKQKTEIDSTSKTNTVIKKDILSDDCIIEPVDTTKPIEITNNFGKTTKYKNAKIRHRKVKDNSIVIIDNITAKKGVKTSEKAIKNKTKLVNKDQFNVSTMLLQFWWLWILLIIAFFVYRKLCGLKILS